MNELIVSLNGNKNKLKFLSDTTLIYNGKLLDFEIIEQANSIFYLRIAKKLYNFTCVQNNSDVIVLFANGEKFELLVRTLLQEKASELLSQKIGSQKHIEVKAPMPGLILKMKKRKGQQVSHGEAVMILEAMKMENEIRSSTDGILKNVFVKEGDKVEKGANLFSIEN